MTSLREKRHDIIKGGQKAFLSVLMFVLLVFGTGEAGYRDYEGDTREKTPYDVKYKRVYRHLQRNETGVVKENAGTSKLGKQSFVDGNREKCRNDFCFFNDARKKVEEYLKKAFEFQYDKELFYEGLPNPAFNIKGAMADYWQLPHETEKRGRGDCEDKAIWLYSKLIKEGFRNVRLVIGKYRLSDILFHAWVVWYIDDKVMILDPTKRKTIEDLKNFASDTYRPYYSYYKEKKWCHTVC